MRGASNDQILDLMFEQAIFRDARQAGSTSRAYWTRAYVDPEGAWVVAHATPIGPGLDAAALDAGGLNVGGLDAGGVVGSTVLLDFLTGFLRAFDYPSGQLWLVNQHAQILGVIRPAGSVRASGANPAGRSAGSAARAAAGNPAAAISGIP